MARRGPLEGRSGPNKLSGGFIIGIIFVLIFVGGIIYNVSYTFTHGTETITVCSKENYGSGTGSSIKRVYAADSSGRSAVFVVDDSTFPWYKASANTYGQLQPNTTYAVYYKGFRFPLFSKMPNILTANAGVPQRPSACAHIS